MLFGEKATKDIASDMPQRDDKIVPPPATPRESPMSAVTSTPTRAMPAMKESVLAAELTIEGKIEGAGHVRIAGRFKGDVQVKGNVTIEQGAVVTGEVKAEVVVIAGQVDGNVEAVSRVELQPTGILNGDVKAATLTVAAGSRMRGRAEFGWNDKPA